MPSRSPASEQGCFRTDHAARLRRSLALLAAARKRFCAAQALISVGWPRSNEAGTGRTSDSRPDGSGAVEIDDVGARLHPYASVDGPTDKEIRMNHHFQWHFMRPLNAAAQSGQPGDALPPSRLRRVQRTQGDLTLGAVAFGALLLLLAWVVTGIDLFAVPVLLIAAASIAVSFTIGPRFPVNIDDGGRLGAFTAVRRLQHHASHRRWQLGRPRFCRDASPPVRAAST